MLPARSPIVSAAFTAFDQPGLSHPGSQFRAPKLDYAPDSSYSTAGRVRTTAASTGCGIGGKDDKNEVQRLSSAMNVPLSPENE